MGAGIVQRGIGVRHAVVVVGRLRVGDFLLGGEQGGIALDHKIGGRLLGFGHVLRHLTHAPLGRNEVFAAIFMQGAVEKGEQ